MLEKPFFGKINGEMPWFYYFSSALFETLTNIPSS
jgi:hypothetical protein